MKQCFKCGEVKVLSEFYKHPRMPDGHENKCKTCKKADVIANRLARIEKYRQYDRDRGNRQTPEDLRRYRKDNPKKHAAHQAISRAVSAGRICPGVCEKCGSTSVHGHHDDYDKPLEVRWLCPVHHKAWHAANGEALNG